MSRIPQPVHRRGSVIAIGVLVLLTWYAADSKGVIACPEVCTCSGNSEAPRLNCSNLNLTSIPLDIGPKAAILDLSRNKIRNIQEHAFSNLKRLQELNLAYNHLDFIPDTAFLNLTILRTLHLQQNRFQSIPTPALKPLVNLENIHFSWNNFVELKSESLSTLPRVQNLWLDNNGILRIPVAALIPLTRLKALYLAFNKIREVPNYSFITLKKLVILMLQNNNIDFIGSKAFDGLVSLKVLKINGNTLHQMPGAISNLPALEELSFADNRISVLGADTFKSNPQLSVLGMSGNPITFTEKSTFSELPMLKKLVLSEARNLEEFPDLTGTSSLEHLRLDRASLITVPPELCDLVPLLRSLNLKSNRISEIPVLLGCTELRLIDLSNNVIISLGLDAFINQMKLIDLFLSHNSVQTVSERSFIGLESLQVLDLESNEIQEIHALAFSHFKDLRDLNLGANRFPTLPTEGLQNLHQLKTFNNRELKEFPPTSTFPRINTLALSYAYHCCEFLSLAHKAPSRSTSLRETIVWLTKEDVDMSSWNANNTDVWPGYENFSTKLDEFANQLLKAFGRDYAIPNNLAQYAEYFEDYKSTYSSEESLLPRFTIQCLPEPGPFMPCEDLFGWWSLRCGVWVVFLLALLGNGVVVIVLLIGRSKMDVPRFLVCNLAGADFFMGVYLGMLAVVDASTLGEFKASAVKWQTSVGCQVAGFLGVLSSELSVFTLSVITLERNYAITHAMHLNKRLSLRHAGYIMLAGWSFASVMAMLPLFGVSDYRKFAICLPFETKDPLSLGYVVFLILINGVAFLILMGCYLKMYCAIRGSQAWNSNDSRIARRMALLVFTDFICWAPIAFFSLTAVFGVQLISLEEAKVFAIFVLPLNSCANPFLYAIFTKQFKKDCIHICKRIEESRVTRGIGRGRHSSNFSNRHTPATTNSASDRKNGNEQVVCNCRSWKSGSRPYQNWKSWALRYILCRNRGSGENHNDGYTYAIAQIQKNIEKKRRNTCSFSSENFSSRSDSWRQANIPLRLMDQGARRVSWTYQRKASQDSNMSCSRQDSSTSTFRLSRSSFSSDSSHQPRASCSRSLSAAPLICEVHGRGCAPKPESELDPLPSQSFRALLGKDKPKLCRQAAVADESNSSRLLAKVSNSEVPSGSGPTASRNERICPVCCRKEASPPLVFKNKELEEKFTCFYNRLAESSHEDSSEVCSSKEEQLVLSADLSMSEGKACSFKEDSVANSATDDNAMDMCRPHIEVNPMSHSNEDFDVVVEDGDASCSPATPFPDVNPRCIDAQKVHKLDEVNALGYQVHLCVISSEEDEKKCKSLTNIVESKDLRSGGGRKSSSDNSLTMFPLSHLPSFFRSFSSQSNSDKKLLSKRASLFDSVTPNPCVNKIRTSMSVNVMSEDFGTLHIDLSEFPKLEDQRHEEKCPHPASDLRISKKANVQHPKIKTSCSTPNITLNKSEYFPLIGESTLM